MTHYIQNESYPFASRDELLDQMYGMRSKYTDYAAYSKAKLPSIFAKAELRDAAILKANELETVYLENTKAGFVRHKLPAEIQFSPIYEMALIDYNKDGNMDFIAAGNQSAIRIRVGVIDANFGQLFEGDGTGNFKYVPQTKSGLRLTGDVKSLALIPVNQEQYLIVGTNNAGVTTFKVNSK